MAKAVPVISPGDTTKVMGILNITPDSFHDGGRYVSCEKAVEQGVQMARAGAFLIDIGGESSRPGARPVSADEEAARILETIEALRERIDLPLSVDTTKASVAERALQAGASMINDISAGLIDPEILELAAHWKVPYIAMHMRGTPSTMQQDTSYQDLIGEICEYFSQRLETFVHAGMTESQVIFDPGIGFGKSPQANYLLLASLEAFRTLGRPILVGPSRKSFLRLAGGEQTGDRLPGTLAAVTICALAGVEVVRVHDVEEAAQAVGVASRVKNHWNSQNRMHLLTSP